MTLKNPSLGKLLTPVSGPVLLRGRATNGDDEQGRLHAAAAKTFDAIAGGDRNRSATVRTAMRRRLTARRGR